MTFLIKEGETNLKYILVVVILATIFGGILIWQTQLVLEQEIKLLEPIVENETANWKIYRNEKHGFEFKYPDGMTFKSQEIAYQFELYMRFSPDLQKHPTHIYFSIRDTQGENLRDYILKWYEKPSFRDSDCDEEKKVCCDDIICCDEELCCFIGEGAECWPIKPPLLQEFKLGGIEGLGKYYPAYPDVGNYYFQKDNLVYLFQTSLGDYAIMRKIISTFKFIEK